MSSLKPQHLLGCLHCVDKGFANDLVVDRVYSAPEDGPQLLAYGVEKWRDIRGVHRLDFENGLCLASTPAGDLLEVENADRFAPRVWLVPIVVS